MEELNVRLLDPKVKALLLNLEEMNLIRITAKPTLPEILEKLRRNESETPTLEEITVEVELVREKQYEEKIKNNP